MTTFILLVKWSTVVLERRSRNSPARGLISERSKLGHKRCRELLPSHPDGCCCRGQGRSLPVLPQGSSLPPVVPNVSKHENPFLMSTFFKRLLVENSSLKTFIYFSLRKSIYNYCKEYKDGASPGGSKVRNPPAKPGDMDLIPGAERSHVPWSN